VPAIIRYARHPQRLEAKHSLIIEDLLAMAYAGKQACVDAVVKMIADLYQQGEACRYIKALGGSVYELKTRTPAGGARVYFFRGNKAEFILCRAECKRETAASVRLLETVIDVLEAHVAGQNAFEGESHEKSLKPKVKPKQSQKRFKKRQG
jgi:hypothetical protein